ncbi:MAG: TetR family transcriptional regulator [Deltaproteobacteria bacterium]|nr:TetR family transcriptional regulator [Deltaproteobacteria bacterium]HCH66124.1 TetR family transcriptional regulator [Deltaproteobacteria bacterium]
MNEVEVQSEKVRSGRQRSDKRVRIVDAAVAVFAAKGYRSARISDIARRAGVADGTIYLYFRNKEDLLLTIFEEKMDGILRGLRAAVDGIADPAARMRAFARFHFEQMRLQPALAQVLQVELRQSTRFVREYRPERLWEYLGVFETILQDGQAGGDFRSDIDPFLVKWAFFGALDELSIQWVLARKRDRFNLEKAAEQVVDVFLHGMGSSTS